MSGIVSWLIIGVAIAIFVGALFVFIRHVQLTTPRKGEPSILPTPLPYIGHALKLGARPIDFMIECSKKTSEIFGILLAGRRIFVVHDVNSAQTIIQANKDLSIFESHAPFMINLFNFPREVAHSPHVDYDIIRKFFPQYLLNDKSLDLLCKRMTKRLSEIYGLQVSKQLQSSKGEGCTVRLFDFISRFVFHIAVGAMYTDQINDSPEKCEKLFESFRKLDKATAICAAGLHVKYLSDSFEALKYLQETTNSLKENLSELLQRRCQYFEEISKHDPAFHNNGGMLNSPIFWATVSNSMPGVFWLLFHILQKPLLLQQIREEIKEHIPNYQRFLEDNFMKDDTQLKNEAATIEQLNQLVTIDACFSEALRLYSGSIIIRTVMKDGLELQLDSGNKYSFRKGDEVALFPALFHYDDEIYPDAEQFNPARFMLPKDRPMEDRIAAALGKTPLKKGGRELNSANVYLPFGAGVTYCPGRRFIRSEAKLLFIILILNLDFELKGDVKQVLPDPARGGIGIFPPVVDIDCVIRKRKEQEQY